MFDEEYWLEAFEAEADEVHPSLLLAVPNADHRQFSLYCAPLLIDEEVPTGTTIEFAIDTAAGMARGLVRHQYHRDGAPIDSASNVLTIPGTDPEKVAEAFFDIYKTGAASE